MSEPKKVLFLVPYPLKKAPSQRYRVELFLPELNKARIEYTIKPFVGIKTWEVLYSQGSLFLKTWGLLQGFFKRFGIIIFKLHLYDFVFIHREASPLGPPVFEWIIAKLYKKKIIYDFDDAIWIPNITVENKVVSWFKCFWKIKYHL